MALLFSNNHFHRETNEFKILAASGIPGGKYSNFKVYTGYLTSAQFKISVEFFCLFSLWLNSRKLHRTPKSDSDSDGVGVGVGVAKTKLFEVEIGIVKKYFPESEWLNSVTPTLTPKKVPLKELFSELMSELY